MNPSKLKFYQNTLNAKIKDIENKILNLNLELQPLQLLLKEFNEDVNRFWEVEQPYDQIDFFHSLLEYKPATSISYDVANELGIRFSKFTSHIFPSLFLGYEASLIKYLVAADPLYISNWDQNFLQGMITEFNHFYQKRLRLCPLENKLDTFNNFPVGQFSLILCWDVIPFLNMNNVNFIINCLNKLLRPGGTLIFNFNNCEKINQLKLLEKLTQTYQIPIKLYSTLDNFKVIEYVNFSNDIDYFVCRKEGELKSVKMQASRAQILSK